MDLYPELPIRPLCCALPNRKDFPFSKVRSAEKHQVISFLTLFLSLTFGPQPVEVSVGDEVAAVEILLNGKPLTSMSKAPWRAVVDLGSSPAPWALEAVALDSRGAEIGRVRQLLNIPRERVEASWVLEGGASPETPRRARLVWQAVAREARQVHLQLDGQALEVEDPRSFELPPYDPSETHVLSASIVFSEELEVNTVTSFGRGFSDSTSSKLTAIPIEIEEGRKRPLSPEDLKGWFQVQGEPVEVIASEQAPMEVLVVRDIETAKTLANIDIGSAAPRESARRTGAGVSNPRIANNSPPPRSIRLPSSSGQMMSGLSPSSRLRFVSSWPTRSTSEDRLLFPISLDLVALTGRGIPFAVTRGFQSGADPGAQRLADAVAVAGLRAAATHRPRLVILILGDSPQDVSSLALEDAYRFLDSLGVPLEVWWARGDRRSAPPTSRPGLLVVKNRNQLRQAVRQVAKRLERQRIVWLSGSFLPQEVRLSEAAEGVALLAQPAALPMQ